MTEHFQLRCIGLLALFASAGCSPGGGSGGGQSTALVPPAIHKPRNWTALIPGTVVDLSRDGLGRLLYCTSEGEVGQIAIGGQRTVLATSQSGPFPAPLRALAETPGGDIAVLDVEGDLRVLVGGNAPAQLIYDDLYMINDASDLIVDARGSFLIASATPSTGQRAMNWVSSDGASWSYYLVKHQPAQLAHDPFTGGIAIADATMGGYLQLVTAGSVIHATTALDTTTKPGFSVAQGDGDLAAEHDGDLYWIAGGSVYKHTRATGSTTLFASGFGPLRGVAIAASSTAPPPPSPWSLYVAEGSNPSRVRELKLPGIQAPGALIATDQGPVPTKGKKVNVNFGFQVYDLAADNQGRLLVGGTLWGSTQFIKRVTLTGMPSIAPLASSADGLLAPIEGLSVAPDDSIYALGRTGDIQRITESPLTVTTVFSDPTNAVTWGKDLALDVSGAFYIAARESWSVGKLVAVNAGVATVLANTQESRGLAAKTAGGMYFSQWNNAGFAGSVDLLHFNGNWIEPQPGFTSINYSNGPDWGDGDVCVDAAGSVYTISEDDWSLVRYDPQLQGFERVGSGYLNRPSGLAIAPSTANSGSTTGWSLYASEFDNLWELPSVPAPASTLVNASLGVGIGMNSVGTLHPRWGRPRSIQPGLRRDTLLVTTAENWVLELDTKSGVYQELWRASSLEPVQTIARVGDESFTLNGWVVWRLAPNSLASRMHDLARPAPAR